MSIRYTAHWVAASGAAPSGTTLNLTVGSLELTGQTLGVSSTTALGLTKGILELTGQTLVILGTLGLAKGPLELTGQTTESKVTLEPTNGSLELTGQTLGILESTVLLLTRGRLRLTGKPTTVTGVASTPNRILRDVGRQVRRLVRRLTN